MKRSWMLPAVATLAVAALTLAPAGAGNGGPTWTSAPTQGPSPNTIAVEGNHCESSTLKTAGVTLGGDLIVPASGEVIVALHDKDTDEVIHLEEYTAVNGTWGGNFPIEAGLDPGVYPLRAECHPTLLRAGGISLGQNGVGVFDYDDRSYRVIAEADDPDAVEADVNLTG